MIATFHRAVPLGVGLKFFMQFLSCPQRSFQCKLTAIFLLVGTFILKYVATKLCEISNILEIFACAAGEIRPRIITRLRERQKSRKFNEQNINSARTLRFFVHFFAKLVICNGL